VKTSNLRNLSTSATVLVSTALAIVLSGVAFAQDNGTGDIELDFRFLHLGLTRKAVVNMLGTPNASTDSKTLAISYHKLMWLGPEGKKFVASFVQDRLWRWKVCSATVADC
jgi:hypothetical protein